MVKHLALADRFERFLAKRFNTAKRFGVEGLETLIPGLNAVLDEAAVQGVTNVVLGMAHRGRLNVLTNVMRKPFELVFQEFHGILESPHDWCVCLARNALFHFFFFFLLLFLPLSECALRLVCGKSAL